MTYTPNEDRSNSLNPNNTAHDAAIKNMYRQPGANVWFRIVHISDMTGENRPFTCDRITNTSELKAFLGGDFIKKEGVDCTHADPGCLCVVDFPLTAKSKPGFRLDIGDKHDLHNFLLMKEPIKHW